MRRLVVAAAVALALPAFAKPGMEAFFDAMAIQTAPGQQARFVVGDNIAGYYDGLTHGTGAGYVIGQGAFFVDAHSFTDGAVNERASASEQVLPYGHRLVHANGVHEEMALLSKKHALAFSIASPRAARLGLTPLFKDAGAIAMIDGVLTVAGDKNFAAIAANVPVSLNGLALQSTAKVRAMTVVIAFGATAAEAAQRARALVRGDPLKAEKQARYERLTRSYLATSDAQYDKALNWAKAASDLFVVEEFGTGIWAGLPWFRDNWGRDTFIALPGTLLVNGQFDTARAVLANFARYQNLQHDSFYGRIPNRVSATESTIYNTVDGTPWMLREALEYIRYTGDRAFAAQMHKLALPYFEGAIANFTDADGLLTHDSADTWMDARIEGKAPWSARGPRAVEIQALWFEALRTGAYLAEQAGDGEHARQWSSLAGKAKASFLRKFWDGEVMADRLREDGSRDTKVRPNQLMLVSIPNSDFVPLDVQAKVTRNAVSQLLYPYGVASLSQDDPYFHPRHENPAYHHKDAAYHQGTVWGWNAGFTVTALNKFGYQDLAWKLTQNLGDQILHLGTLGTMSELLDALPDDTGKVTPSGTFAQSWSVAEYARNGYQDYVGFKPDMLANTLVFSPAIPGAWTHFDAELPFAKDSARVAFRRVGDGQRWTLRIGGKAARTVRFVFVNADKSRSQIQFELRPGTAATLLITGGDATLDGKRLAVTAAQPSMAATIGELAFVTPKRYRPEDFPMLRSKDALKGIIERGEYK